MFPVDGTEGEPTTGFEEKEDEKVALAAYAPSTDDVPALEATAVGLVAPSDTEWESKFDTIMLGTACIFSVAISKCGMYLKLGLVRKKKGDPKKKAQSIFSKDMLSSKVGFRYDLPVIVEMIGAAIKGSMPDKVTGELQYFNENNEACDVASATRFDLHVTELGFAKTVHVLSLEVVPMSPLELLEEENQEMKKRIERDAAYIQTLERTVDELKTENDMLRENLSMLSRQTSRLSDSSGALIREMDRSSDSGRSRSKPSGTPRFRKGYSTDDDGFPSAKSPYVWDEDYIDSTVHLVSGSGKTVTHMESVLGWHTVLVKHPKIEDKMSVSFRIDGHSKVFFGVLSSTEDRLNGAPFGSKMGTTHIQGVGYIASMASVSYPPAKRIQFGSKAVTGDVITVEYSCKDHKLRFYRNKVKMFDSKGKSLMISSCIDVSKGLRFAVQTEQNAVVTIL